ncbi:glycerophosphodiester phosphodiesterase [Candidatus Uhrbacteria bacterium]|nr:glycerophosphodiester phosphodiesterase [Candidatus Uhrbacteria bacterium]
MRIFAHKGLWKVKRDANTLTALQRAFAAGFDAETDIHLQNGNFVIKHDPPLANEVLLELKDALTVLKDYGTKCMAIHCKYDDQRASSSLDKMIALLTPFARQVFLFDLSLNYCQALKKRNKNIKIGVSVGDKKYHDKFCDLEEALQSDDVDIIWADEYRKLYSKEFVEMCHKRSKLVYCISPDLAGIVGHPQAEDGYQETWKNLISWGADGICTDHPLELRSFLKVCK